MRHRAGWENVVFIQDSFDNKVMEVVQTADGERQITSFENDVWGRVVKRCDPNLFDAETKAKWAAQTLRYDPVGYPAECTGPDTGIVRFVYDWRGRLHYEQPQDGAEEGWYIYHLYDELDREIEVGKETGKWDEDAFREKANAGGGCLKDAVWSRRFRYDGEVLCQNQLGRLWQCETSTENGTVTEIYIYDCQGNITWQGQRFLEKEYGVHFVYDLSGNLLSQFIDGQEKNKVSYEYDLAGRMKSVWWSEQQICENKYDKAGMLAAEVMTALQGQTLTRSYAYDSAGWATRIQDDYFCQSIRYRPENGRVDTMQVQIKQAPDGFAQMLDTSCDYDGFGRITKVELAQFPQHGLGTATALQYDANSNLLSGDGTKYEYVQGSNRLAQRSDISYQYNAKGACTRREKNGTSLKLVYDKVINCVLTIQDAAGKSVYHQGADGVIACETEDGVTQYLQDAKGRLFAQIDSDGTVCLCVYGANGPLAQVRNGVVYFMLKDYQSSVRAVWDGDKLCAAWHYTPLGQIIEGAYETGAVLELIPFRFAGQLLAGHGLYRTKYRFYDPEIGRFLSVDPERQYNSPYLFGNCDWINYYDPDGAFSFGNFFLSLCAVAVGIALIGVGIVATIATAGTAAPLLGITIGAAIAGFGFASVVYGVVSLCTNEFDVGDFIISAISGAVMGALSAIIGAALPVLTGWTAVLTDAAVGMLIGAADGVVTNGVINTYHLKDFTDNWMQNMIIGGALGCIFGGISGVGRAYHNQNAVNQGGVNSYWIRINSHKPLSGGKGMHSSAGTVDNLGNRKIQELRVAQPWKKNYTGQTTRVVRSINNPQTYQHIARQGTWEWAYIPIRGSTYWNVSRYLSKNIPNGKYSYFTNNCVTASQDLLRAAGIEVPIWIRTPDSLLWWVQTLTRHC